MQNVNCTSHFFLATDAAEKLGRLVLNTRIPVALFILKSAGRVDCSSVQFVLRERLLKVVHTRTLRFAVPR